MKKSKSKRRIKWWILFVVSALLIWWSLPQRTLRIKIDAAPDGPQLFHVETQVILSQWHGVGNHKSLDRRLLSPNQTHRLSIDGNLRPWSSGKMIVRIKHPEYRAVALLETGYRGGLLVIEPQFWPQLLQNAPLLELKVPHLTSRPLDYEDQLIAGEILPLATLSYHMAWVKNSYLPALADTGDIQMMTGSMPVLQQLVDFVNSNSAGRTDGNEYTDADFESLKEDLIAVERQLK